VIATTEEGTRAALAEARQFSADRGPARVILLVPQVVSFLKPLDSPSEIYQIARRYRNIAALAGVEATVRVCVCRRPEEVFRWMVNARSTVVLGGRRRWWWHTEEQDLAGRLTQTGRDVIFADVARCRS
jgi:hypothetical protein